MEFNCVLIPGSNNNVAISDKDFILCDSLTFNFVNITDLYFTNSTPNYSF